MTYTYFMTQDDDHRLFRRERTWRWQYFNGTSWVKIKASLVPERETLLMIAVSNARGVMAEQRRAAKVKRFKFRADYNSDGLESPTNGERSEWAFRTLLVFGRRTGQTATADREDCAKDLVTDLGHFCDEHGIDFELLVERAVANWKDER